MTIGQETRRAARRARHPLADRAETTAAFLVGRLHPDGGFQGRSDAPDLYYTLFGVEALGALNGSLPADKLTAYLQAFGDGEALDLVHLACLVRCWVVLDAPPRDEWVACLNAFRSSDGGFATEKGARFGSAYGAFLAIGALQDLGARVPDADRIADALLALRTPDGGWANDRIIPVGSVPAAAAAVTVLRHLGHSAPPDTGDWLLGCVQDDGGVAPLPGAGADLLSTAVALHALAGLGIGLGERRDACLAFVESLWDPRGAFRGSPDDALLDCEYTWYGLLAIGHLSEEA